MGSPLAKRVPVVPTKTTVGSPLAKHVPVVLTAVSVHRVVLVCTRIARVASVATVVVVGVKLPRPPRVERGRRRWVGVRRRVLGHRRAGLPGVLIIMIFLWSSTLKTQTSPAAAALNVSAHLLVHQAPTKIKVSYPLAKHVTVVLTALLVPQVVRILQLLVLLEPMPVVQHPVLDALRVALVKEKRLRALRHRIVFVLKTFVLVPTALQRRAQPVLPMVLIFVRRVAVDFRCSLIKQGRRVFVRTIQGGATLTMNKTVERRQLSCCYNRYGHGQAVGITIRQVA